MAKAGQLYRGELMSFQKIAKLHNVNWTRIRGGYNKYKCIEKAILYAKTPDRKERESVHTYKGIKYTPVEYSKILHKDYPYISESVFLCRIKEKWDFEEMITISYRSFSKKGKENKKNFYKLDIKIFNLNKELLATFNNYIDASAYLNIKAVTISTACQKGFILNKKYLVTSVKVNSDKILENRRKEEERRLLSRNTEYCSVRYKDPELEKLSVIQYKKITKQAYNRANRVKIRIQQNLLYAKNKNKIRERRNYYFQNNIGGCLDRKRFYAKEKCKSLTDSYVKRAIQVTLGLPFSKITSELVDIKRKQLSLYRTYIKTKNYEKEAN